MSEAWCGLLTECLAVPVWRFAPSDGTFRALVFMGLCLIVLSAFGLLYDRRRRR